MDEKPKAFKKGMGRPTKLTDEVQKNILAAIDAGNYMETAAAYAGVSKDVFLVWMRKGRNQKKGRLHDFVHLVQMSLAKAEVRDVLVIGNAASQQWQAAAWRLERKFPDRWGRRDIVQHSGLNGDAIQIETRTRIMDKISLDAQTKEDFLRLADRLEPADETDKESPLL